MSSERHDVVCSLTQHHKFYLGTFNFHAQRRQKREPGHRALVGKKKNATWPLNISRLIGTEALPSQPDLSLQKNGVTSIYNFFPMFDYYGVFTS